MKRNPDARRNCLPIRIDIGVRPERHCRPVRAARSRLNKPDLVLAGLIHIFAFAPRYNIGPAQRAPVLLKTPKGVQCEEMSWGFKSEWPKTQHINAQAERIQQSSTFNKLLNQRCLVPRDGPVGKDHRGNG